MENEKLKRYALVAEIISAAAVVVSLVFVAFQVKDNTSAIRSSAYDGILSDHIDWRMTVATSPELTEAMLKFDDSDITDAERKSVERAYQALWQIYERAFFARKYETLGDSEWARYESAICRSAVSFDVEAALGRYLTTDFVDFAKSCDPEIDH
jgi:hypothetical protein